MSKRTKRDVSTEQYLRSVVRMVKSAAKTRLPFEDPHMLLEVRALDYEVAKLYHAGVNGMRASGFSDREIGEVLGVTKQSVQERWPRAA